MPRKILVVDDNLDTRELTHLYLTTAGFAVIVASDTREGLYMAVAEHPDLIITDIGMPELNGIELLLCSAQHNNSYVELAIMLSYGGERPWRGGSIR